ncbi:MAG: RNase adapter RapZ [Acidimicrobiales bacterium]
MVQLVVLTGLSGAGRSVAAGALEDLGWFVIDNLPASLVPKVAELAGGGDGSAGFERVALVTAGYDSAMEHQVEALRTHLEQVSVVFLEAPTETLIKRYEATRRRHPLSEGISLADAIVEERTRMLPAREAADLVIDTGELNPHQLRDRLATLFEHEGAPDQMAVSVSSFGFKHGVPLDVDLVLDCRFLPNPHWEDALRPFSGLDPQVRDYVIERDLTQTFIDRLVTMLADLLPAYEDEGKSYLSIAFGCTGGRHRSVAMAEAVAHRLNDLGHLPRVSHRDIER